MSGIARRLSTVELSERILDMAKTGVYRESVFETMQPVATKKQIREAIAHAKQFGLHSVASLRDAELGTYYQVDLVKYQTLQASLKDALPLLEGGELAKRHLEAIALIQKMLQVTKAVAMGMGILGVIGVFTSFPQLSLVAFSGAGSISLLWLIQHRLTGKLGN